MNKMKILPLLACTAIFAPLQVNPLNYTPIEEPANFEQLCEDMREPLNELIAAIERYDAQLQRNAQQAQEAMLALETERDRVLGMVFNSVTQMREVAAFLGGDQRQPQLDRAKHYRDTTLADIEAKHRANVIQVIQGMQAEIINEFEEVINYIKRIAEHPGGDNEDGPEDFLTAEHGRAMQFAIQELPVLNTQQTQLAKHFFALHTPYRCFADRYVGLRDKIDRMKRERGGLNFDPYAQFSRFCETIFTAAILKEDSQVPQHLQQAWRGELNGWLVLPMYSIDEQEHMSPGGWKSEILEPTRLLLKLLADIERVAPTPEQEADQPEPDFAERIRISVRERTAPWNPDHVLERAVADWIRDFVTQDADAMQLLIDYAQQYADFNSPIAPLAAEALDIFEYLNAFTPHPSAEFDLDASLTGGSKTHHTLPFALDHNQIVRDAPARLNAWQNGCSMISDEIFQYEPVNEAIEIPDADFADDF